MLVVGARGGMDSTPRRSTWPSTIIRAFLSCQVEQSAMSSSYTWKSPSMLVVPHS